jgi:NAD-dependent dihydropyrimidine dehydrogenase PreA subunit
MLIDREKCTNCGACVFYCPVGAIKFQKSVYFIDQNLCVECGVCIRSNVCRAKAIYQPELRWPRILRALFSDPLTVHPQTDIPGRGTEEVKTNDVTHRFKLGELGIIIEVGRPGVGTYLEDVEKITKALAAHNVEFEPKNPITYLIDVETGEFKDPRVRRERVLSAIIEFKIKEKDFSKIAEILKNVSKEIDTVISVGVATVCRNTEIPISIFKESGFTPRINGKINLGLGLAWSYK